MKLSELSKRDYIAIEVLGKLAGPHITDQTAVGRAYSLADTMIAFAGKPKRDHEFEEMRKGLDAADRSNEILRQLIPHTEFAATIGLEQIWEFLGVSNQTAAMQMLRNAFPELVK